MEEQEVEPSWSKKGHLYLEYEPVSVVLESDTTTASKGNEIQSQEIKLADIQNNPRKECKSNGQIDDFLRKLGFMDKEKEGGDFIKQFLHLSQVKYIHCLNTRIYCNQGVNISRVVVNVLIGVSVSETHSSELYGITRVCLPMSSILNGSSISLL